jgi:hypothetical protein
MAAIQHPQPDGYRSGVAARPAGGALPPRRRAAQGPALRVLEGGRSARNLAVLYRRRRLAALVLVVLVAVVAVSLVLPAGQAAARGYLADPAVSVPVSPGHEVVVVQPGDTLWSIARSLQPSGDILPLVQRLSEVHGPGALLAGERIDLRLVNGGV